MKFIVFGINHNACPIDIREKLHFTESKIIQASDNLISGLASEVLILSTCNRSETYVITDDNFDKPMAVRFYEDFFDHKGLDDKMYFLSDIQAIKHLINLSLGRESLIVGEDQILGQVKDALDLSQSLNFSKKHINYIFREAISFVKKIKSESNVSSTPISTAYIGLKDIEKNLHIKDKKALVIGIGKMGMLSINYLIDFGAKISISNWNIENSYKLKEKYPDIEIVKFDQIEDKIKDFDLIISATKSPHVIIKKDFFDNLDKKIYILDLALPRDVDKGVEDIENIELYNIDKLSKISDENINKRREILNSYEDTIATRAEEIYEEINDVDISKLLTLVNNKCREVSDFTLSYIERKIDVSVHQKIKLEKIIKSALNKVSRNQILKIKNSSLSKEDKDLVIKILEEAYND